MMEVQVHTERLDITPLALDEIDALIANDGGRLRELTRRALSPPRGAAALHGRPAARGARAASRSRPAEAPWWNWLVFERETRGPWARWRSPARPTTEGGADRLRDVSGSSRATATPPRPYAR